MLPLVVPGIVYLVVPESLVAGLLLFSLGFAGLPYLLFGLFLFFILGRIESESRMFALALTAPLAFAPIFLAFWTIRFFVEKIDNPNLVAGWEATPAFLIYIGVIGYSYVVIALLGYFCLKKFGLVYPPHHHNKGFNRTPESSGPAEPGEFGGGAG